MPLSLERALRPNISRALRPPQPAMLLHLWHLLSLDAPTVATLWTAFLARTVNLHLPATSLIAMFLMVWCLYAADRLLDAQPLHRQPTIAADLERRHLFHHRHRTAFLVALGIATTALAILIPQLPPAALHLFLILGTLLAGYFILIHATSGAHRLPKEIAVGLFFSAAIFIPTVARLPRIASLPPGSTVVHRLSLAATDPRLSLIPGALLFAALCCLNCLCIYVWEHPHHPPHASPHPLTQVASHCRLLLAAAIVLLSLLYALLTRDLIAIALAIALAAVLLLLLDRHRHRLSALTLRAAADLALTTPVLFFPWLLHR